MFILGLFKARSGLPISLLVLGVTTALLQANIGLKNRQLRSNVVSLTHNFR